MDSTVHTFNDELQSLLLSKPPVSKGKMGLITKAAMRGVKFYKHIVQIVEKFIARCRPEYKVPGLYVIDSIVRQSRHQFGTDRDVYAARFARNLGITFENLFTDCLDEDRSRMVRVLNLWLKNGVFDAQTIRPLLDLADPTKAVNFPRDPKSPSSGETNGSMAKRDYPSAQRYGTSAGDKSLKFSKNMLDFDYGEEDDEDETPTEAEPPLSSTLSKIEMEQRVKKAIANENGNEARSSSRGINASNSNNHQSSHTRPPMTKQPTAPPAAPKQDPVLERWNRIIKGEITGDQKSSSANDHHVNRRSRSRSPSTIGDDKLPQHSQAQRKASDHGAPKEYSIQHRKSSGESSSQEVPFNPERAAERERKCLPKIRDKHLTVCSSTLWLGHVPKTVSEVDISDAFGEFGHINSIDLIPPRGCAYVCMDRRQDAKRALSHSKRLKLNGSHIRMAWAPGKGLKEQKKWKDFWESDIGASFVPYAKIDVESLDFDALEEGGVIDEDSMTMEMREKRERISGGPDESVASNETSRNASFIDDRAATAALPMFNQAPQTASSVPAYVIPPPPMNLGIPPPMLLAQGLMRFPPPAVTLAAATSSSSSNLTQTLLPQTTNVHKDSSESRDQDQQQQLLNINERKINMVEQQLNMLQQSQGINQLASTPQSLLYQMQQPDPMVFDFRHTQPQMLQMIPSMLDPNQIGMFDGQQHNPMMVQPQMLQFNQQHLSMADMDDNYLAQTNQEF